MGFKVDQLELGLQYFFNLKYENKIFLYSDLPKFLNSCEYIQFHLGLWDNSDLVKLNVGDYSRLRDLFDQFYRNDYPEFVDSKGLEDC